MNRYLSAHRLGRLIVKDLTEDYRAIIIAVGALTGVLLLNYILNGLSGSGVSGAFTAGLSVPSHNAALNFTFFALTLFIGGFIISSRAFLEVHAKNRNHDWLMLPASPVEKYLSRLILTSIGVGVGAVVYFFLFSLLGSGLMLLLTRRTYPLFNPLDGAAWMLTLHYVVLQSIFFAGAIYFKKLHFIKTVLSLTAFGFLLILVFAGVARILFWKELLVLTTQGSLGHIDLRSIEPRLQSVGETAVVISRIVYWGLIAPVFWALAFFRLRETEVRNGV